MLTTILTSDMTFREVFGINADQSREFEEMLRLPSGFFEREVSNIDLSTCPLPETEEIDPSKVTPLEWEMLDGLKSLSEQKRNTVLLLMRLLGYLHSDEK